MRIERVHAQPNKWTFTIPPIRDLLAEEMGAGLWVDPFAGRHSPAQVRNDLDPVALADHHLDALDFLRQQPPARFDGALYDPPYSITQAVECYRGHGRGVLADGPGNMCYWAACKDELARVVKSGGKVICCGWSSTGLGQCRGFQMRRVLLVAHGGQRNDTIVTVETKIQAWLPVHVPRGSQTRARAALVPSWGHIRTRR